VIKREKIRKIMELEGTIAAVKHQLDMLRHPLGKTDNEFIPISPEEENEIIEKMAKEFDKYWDRETEIDKAIEFLESWVGKKWMDKERKLNKKLHKILDDWFNEKAEKFNQEQLLKAPSPKNQTFH